MSAAALAAVETEVAPSSPEAFRRLQADVERAYRLTSRIWDMLPEQHGEPLQVETVRFLLGAVETELRAALERAEEA